jgi:DNA-directed RNA polymerase specialized sigma subunit, sigma24 homolog
MRKKNYPSFDDDNSKLRAEFTAYLQRVVYHAKAAYIRKYIRPNYNLPVVDISESDLSYVQNWNISQNDFEFEDPTHTEAYSNLSLIQQQVLKLLFVYGLTPQEVAAKMNCPVKSVYNHKHEAMKKLRDKLLRGGK